TVGDGELAAPTKGGVGRGLASWQMWECLHVYLCGSATLREKSENLYWDNNYLAIYKFERWQVSNCDWVRAKWRRRTVNHTGART
ncbi:MAG TPA: hypothetical protein PLL28_10150, partial [Chitinophagales bacterium]|nr:hypothetical protein [Chitinophagales bacterium]